MKALRIDSRDTGMFLAVPSNDPPQVEVVLGGLDGAAEILDIGAKLACGVHARLTIHFAQVVPFPLPLKSPPVPAEFAEERLISLAARQPVETFAIVYLCRDRSEAIRRVLRPGSIVILSAPRGWWRRFEKTLAKLLIRDGHPVVLVVGPKHK